MNYIPFLCVVASSTQPAYVIWLLAFSLVFLAGGIFMYVAARRTARKAAQSSSAGVRTPENRGAPRQKHLLKNSSQGQSTLMKLATYQDAETLRDIAVRETGQMLGAVATYLVRHKNDGSTPVACSWFVSQEYDCLPDDVVQESESADYLDSHVFVKYRRNQKKDNNLKWDSLLGRIGANVFLAGPVRVDGDTWGHVSYVLKRDDELDSSDDERFREACAMVQAGVSRACAIEKRDEHQRQLAAAARAANRAAKAKTLFLATMSHEIRTPLNTLVGFSEFLNDPSNTPEDVKEYTEGISQSANALLAIVNDVLDLSRLESGRVDMTGSCDMPALFRELTNVFRYRARTKSVTIDSHIGQAFPTLNISEEHLRQIMLNLIGNAIKFTDTGSVEWSAECRPDGDGTVALHISVKDTGCGISQDKLRTIFDPYAKNEATRGGKAFSGTTGMGLPIVKRLLDSCGGTINIDSAPGQGTEVYVRIGHVPLVGQADAGPEKISMAKSLDKLSVLLVDDVPLNLKVLSLRMKKMGVGKIAMANSGEEALKALKSTQPDIVLTDMWMPGMNGADLAAAIRSGDICQDVPVIAVTADNDAKASFDMSYFAGIVTKPVSVDKLKDCLEKAARG